MPASSRSTPGRARRLSVPLASVLLPVVGILFTAQAFQIGHMSTTYLDPARNNRQVPVELYYPATVAGEDVPVAPPPAGGFPPISFGHGFLMPYSDYAYIWESLVPAGYILALPRTEGGLFPSHGEFGKDLAFLVRQLHEESANPSSPFYQTVATASAVMGHSMGGGASFLAAAEDPTITALANLAAAETNPSAIGAAAQITAPGLLFAGSYDCVTPPGQHQIPMYQALASDCKTLVTITGASHCQFAEYDYLCNLGEGGCPTPLITREQQHALTIQLLRPWLDFVLKEDGAAWAEFQGLLAGLTGITYLQDCAVDAVAEDLWVPLARFARAIPNPLSRNTRVELEIARPGSVALEILSPAGERVRTLFSCAATPGRWAVEWDGRDERGRPVASGVYLCRVRSLREGAIRLLVVR